MKSWLRIELTCDDGDAFQPQFISIVDAHGAEEKWMKKHTNFIFL